MSTYSNNTRFNPTLNGTIHIGHLYMALVNEAEARDSGGKFIVRFEDNQKEWCYYNTQKQMDQYADTILEDLEWVGIKIDKIEFQSLLEPEYKKMMHHLNGGDLKVRDTFVFDLQPDVTYTNAVAYPYAPYLTAEKVILDFMNKINLLIRGEDLLTEYSLYCYFCDLWGLHRIKHVYLPRLRMPDGSEMQTEISKATGNFKVESYRKAGMKPDKLLAKMREACLIDPDGEWLIKNIKRRPEWKL
jgi:glutamyl/glutaminyl-tRNA synthetase